jgi:hypothetical protein
VVNRLASADPGSPPFGVPKGEAFVGATSVSMSG